MAKVVLDALKHIWLTLEPLQMPMAVMGGLALSEWGHVRATQDVDLLLEIGERSPDALLRTLKEAKIRAKREPAVFSLGHLRIIQLLYEPPGAYLDIQIDLLLAESNYHRQALARRIPTQLPDLDIAILVLTCEDLILHKLLAGRIIDRADAAALLRINRPRLDLGYLSRWTKDLKLAKELLEVWDEAFPGETPPG